MLGQCGGRVRNIKLDKGQFLIKETLSCTKGFNILARTPENQGKMLPQQLSEAWRKCWPTLSKAGISELPLWVVQQMAQRAQRQGQSKCKA